MVIFEKSKIFFSAPKETAKKSRLRNFVFSGPKKIFRKFFGILSRKWVKNNYFKRKKLGRSKMFLSFKTISRFCKRPSFTRQKAKLRVVLAWFWPKLARVWLWLSVPFFCFGRVRSGRKWSPQKGCGLTLWRQRRSIFRFLRWFGKNRIFFFSATAGPKKK